MMNCIPTCRTLLAAGLVLVGLSAGASAQDLYKSRAEMLNAEALNKQANAAIISARATYDKAQAEIAKIHQEIREKASQNDLLETETYYKKRAQHHEYRTAHRAKPRSPEQYTEQARQSAPAKLTAYHFNSESGNLRWPTLLKTAAYDFLRRQIDHLLEKRTLDDSGAGSQNCAQTMVVVEKLKTELRENIRRYTSSDYLAARKFLGAVALEAQRPIAVPAAETLDRVAER